ncbi:MAG TPA: hypothetical protein VHB79_21505 [Polyangiaceae bacterium]|nr:hypothetical protein [Polyangiaceae bacterium]
MKRGQQLGWVFLVGGSLLAFAGCGDDDDSGGNTGGTASHAGASSGGEAQGGAVAVSDGTDECKVMGELCHEADTGAGSPAHECHETGHEGDGSACLKVFAGCINTCVDEAPANLSLADARCAALGELCHPVDDGDGPLHACHELGHENNAPECAAQFADCSTRCLAARELLEAGEGGAGGGGAAAAEHGGAGGVGGASDATAAGTSGSAG